MPGFISGSTALSTFKIDTPRAVTVAKLKQHAFKPIDAVKNEALSIGWTSIEDMLDTSWENGSPEKGDWLCFSLRVDKRTVASAVLNKHYAEAQKKEKEEKGEPKISRTRKKELKELVRSQLLGKTEPAPATVDLALHKESGLLLVSSISKGMLEHVNTHLLGSFGICAKPFMSDNVAWNMRGIYEGGNIISHGDFSYTLSENGHVTLAGVSGAETVEVAVKNDRPSLAAALESGLDVSKIKIRMERENEPDLAWTFTLNSNLEFSGLKIPAAKQGDADPEAVLLERLYLIEQVVGVVHKLFEAEAKD